mgnify:CR=1 FL=1
MADHRAGASCRLQWMAVHPRYNDFISLVANFTNDVRADAVAAIGKYALNTFDKYKSDGSLGGNGAIFQIIAAGVAAAAAVGVAVAVATSNDSNSSNKESASGIIG